MYEQELKTKLEANKIENTRRLEAAQDAMYRGYADHLVPAGVRARRALRATQGKSIGDGTIGAENAPQSENASVEGVAVENEGVALTELVKAWVIAENPEGVSTAYILEKSVNITDGTKPDQMIVGDVMKQLGYTKARVMISGERAVIWNKQA